MCAHGRISNLKPVGCLSISMILLFHGCGLLGTLLYPISTCICKRKGSSLPWVMRTPLQQWKAGEGRRALFLTSDKSIHLTQFHKGVLMSPLAC